MALEFNGKLFKVLPQQTGTGSRGNWVKQEFVVETTEQFPKKICCSLWGDKADSLKSYKQGDEIKVYFNLESREYNERWYTDVRAWKIEPGSKGSSSSSSSSSSAPSAPADISGEEEDLPF